MIREAEPTGNNCVNCYHVDNYTNLGGKLYLRCSLLRCGFNDAPIINKPEHTICNLWRHAMKFRKKPIVVEAYQTELTTTIHTLEGDEIADEAASIIRAAIAKAKGETP